MYCSSGVSIHVGRLGRLYRTAEVVIALAVPQKDRESVNSLSQSFGSCNAGIAALFNRTVNKPVYFRRERAANAELTHTLAKCTLLAAVDFPIQVE
jgi:hypothetical protein